MMGQWRSVFDIRIDCREVYRDGDGHGEGCFAEVGV